MKLPFAITLFILSLSACTLLPSTQPPAPTPIPTPPQATHQPDLQAQLDTAFTAKHPDWDMTTIALQIDLVQGDYAKGMVVPKVPGGGGLFFAAKTDSGWVIVSDGNGVVLCIDIADYAFPTTIIPECFDPDSGQVVIR